LAACLRFHLGDDRPGVLDLVGRNLAHRIAVEIEARTTGGERTLIHQSKAISEEQGAALIGRQHTSRDKVQMHANFQRPMRLQLLRGEATAGKAPPTPGWSACSLYGARASSA